MKRVSLVFLFVSLSFFIMGQNVSTEEIKIQYTNGLELFNVCEQNPQMDFKEKSTYYWYTEFSKIKSTKGGAGGQLLHGSYKFYDEKGNLRSDKNYYLGLSDKKEINWDSTGNIVTKLTYDKGKIVYWKFLNDEDYWIEFNGQPFKQGTVRKVSTKYGRLISEEERIGDGLKQNVKTYFEDTGKLKEVYTNNGFEAHVGKYTSYYRNGRIKFEGQFYKDGYNDIRDGIWKWYNKDGSLDDTENYKAFVEFWDNGDFRVAGSLIYSDNLKEWKKTGVWTWYFEDGRIKDKKEFEWGVEVTKNSLQNEEADKSLK